MARWQPFETAPKNRTVLLVYRPDAGVFTALYCPARAADGEEDEDNYCWFTTQGEDIDDDLPTHWMPLPQGPDHPAPGAEVLTSLLAACEMAYRYIEADPCTCDRDQCNRCSRLEHVASALSKAKGEALGVSPSHKEE